MTRTLPQTPEPVPIPPAERALPTVMAEPFARVPMAGVTPGLNILEGLAFGRDGGLYLCSADMETGDAAIFRTRALARALPGFAWS